MPLTDRPAGHRIVYHSCRPAVVSSRWPQSTVFPHLACLRDCQLIVARPEGCQMFYSLTHVGLLDLWTSAEQLLADTGEAVALCPIYGVSPQHRAGKP
jgi:hypothetical protein